MGLARLCGLRVAIDLMFDLGAGTFALVFKPVVRGVFLGIAALDPAVAEAAFDASGFNDGGVRICKHDFATFLEGCKGKSGKTRVSKVQP